MNNRSRNWYSIFVFFLILTLGCRRSKTTTEVNIGEFHPSQKNHQLEDSLLKANKINNYQKVLIIPGNSCPTCLRSILDVINQDFDGMDHLFIVFTHFVTFKTIKKKLQNQIANGQNVFFDKQDIFYTQRTEKHQNPILLILDPFGSKVKRVQKMWPGDEKFIKAVTSDKNEMLNLNISEIIHEKHLGRSSQIMDSIRYVALETTPDILVGKVKKIIVNNSNIFISSGKKIQRFLLNGSFVWEIDSRGNGPKEYSQISDFFIHNERIYILDPNRRRVCIFNSSGEFDREIEFNSLFPVAFGPVSKKHFQISTRLSNFKNINEAYDIATIDHEGSIHWKGIINPKKYIPSRHYVMSGGDFHTFNGRLFFKRPFEQIVYKSKPNGLNPVINLGLNELQMPQWIYETTDLYRRKLHEVCFRIHYGAIK